MLYNTSVPRLVKQEGCTLQAGPALKYNIDTAVKTTDHVQHLPSCLHLLQGHYCQNLDPHNVAAALMLFTPDVKHAQYSITTVPVQLLSVPDVGRL